MNLIIREAEIDSLYISSEYKNIGTKLIEEIINILKEKSVKYVFIKNLVENESAKCLYEKLKFKIFREDRRKELI